MTLVKSNSRKLKIPADESYLSEVREFVTEITRSLGFGTKDINSIKLAVDEGCTNIIRHAYRDIPNGIIEILTVIKQSSLTVVLIDRGKSFDFKKASDPNLQTYMKIGKKGGLGIFLMKKLMDEVEYHVTNRGNELWLTKRITKEEEPVLGFLPRKLSLKIKVTAVVSMMFSAVVLSGFWFLYESQGEDVRESIFSSGISAARNLSLDSWVDLTQKNDLNLASQVKNVVEENPLIAEAFIVDQDNKIWAHSDIGKTFTHYQTPGNLKLVEHDDRMVSIFAYTLPKGKELLQISTPIKIMGTDADGSKAVIGRANIVIPYDEIQRGINEAQGRMKVIALILLIFGNIGVFSLSYLLMKPFQRLASWVRGMGEGSMDEALVLDTNDEMGEIAEAFNDMAFKFRKAQGSLVEKERLQQEVMVAQEIQHMLLPRAFPTVEGFDIASFYRAAKEVGGDYFDFVWVDPDTLGLVVADVSGKGVPGSLVMTMIRTTLRLEARGNKSASDVLSNVNRFVSDDIKKGMFVTMFYIILDSRKRRIDFASAGHNPLILYRNKTSKTYYLNPEGFPVGISIQDDRLFDESIHSDFLRLSQGDLLIAYTDGLTEAMNPQREQFGDERFLEAIRKYANLLVGEFVENIRREIQEFTQGFPQNDDITLVAIKEKLSADSHIQEFRTKLIKMVEEEGVSVKDACRRMRVSPSTYYRYKKRWDEEGEEGLKNRIESDNITERHISIEDRQKIFDIIKKHPEYGAKRIVQELNTEQYEFFEIPETRIYEELKRLNLNTEELRRQYAEKDSTDGGRPRLPGTPLLTLDGKVVGLSEFAGETDEASDGNGRPRVAKRLPPAQKWSADDPADVIATNIPGSTGEVSQHDPPRRAQRQFREGVRRIPPKSPMWPSPEQMEPRESETHTQFEGEASAPGTPGTWLPSHMIHPAVRLIPLIIHDQRELAGFVSKEIDRTLRLGKKILVLDCSGVEPSRRILWNDLVKSAQDFRKKGGDVFLWNLQSLHLDEYQKHGVKRNVVHLTSHRDLEERLRFLRL